LNFAFSAERINAAVTLAEAPKGPLSSLDPATLRAALEALAAANEGKRWTDRAEFIPVLKAHLKASGLTVGTPALKVLWQALSERDDTAKVCIDVKGNPEPDTHCETPKTSRSAGPPPAPPATPDTARATAMRSSPPTSTTK